MFSMKFLWRIFLHNDAAYWLLLGACMLQIPLDAYHLISPPYEHAPISTSEGLGAVAFIVMSAMAVWRRSKSPYRHLIFLMMVLDTLWSFYSRANGLPRDYWQELMVNSLLWIPGLLTLRHHNGDAYSWVSIPVDESSDDRR